jgi:hypothetical protein
VAQAQLLQVLEGGGEVGGGGPGRAVVGRRPQPIGGGHRRVAGIQGEQAGQVNRNWVTSAGGVPAPTSRAAAVVTSWA